MDHCASLGAVASVLPFHFYARLILPGFLVEKIVG